MDVVDLRRSDDHRALSSARHVRAVSFGIEDGYGLGAFAVGQVCDQQFDLIIGDVRLQCAAVDRSEFAILSGAESPGGDASSDTDGGAGHSIYGLSGDQARAAMDIVVWAEQSLVSGMARGSPDVHLRQPAVG